MARTYWLTLLATLTGWAFHPAFAIPTLVLILGGLCYVVGFYDPIRSANSPNNQRDSGY